MEDDVEVTVAEETPSSFVDDEGTTNITVGEEKKEGDKGDDGRWAEALQQQNRLAADLADIRVRLAGSPSQTQASPATGPDPYKAAEDAISERERALGIQWEAYRKAGQLTHDRLVEFDQKSRELQQERINLGSQRAMQNVLPQLLQAAERQRYQAEYGDVQSNPAANRWARGHYDMLVAQGAPESPETVRQAMNAARAQFRIGNYRSAPTQQDRDQFSGFSGNAGRRNVSEKSNVVKMGKSEKIMAMAMYGDAFKGDEKKAYAQWAKGPGIKAQKAMQRARRQA